MNNWLQSLTESYKQISLQKELENLIEEIHNEQPTLNENDIKEFLLNELKMASPEQIQKVGQAAYDRAVWGKGIVGKVKSLMGRFGLAKPPKGHPTVSTRYYAERGIKPTDDDAEFATQKTKESLTKLSQMKPGEASGVVADLARGDRAMELANRLAARQQGQIPHRVRNGTWPVSDHTKVEKQARAREQMGIGPQGTTAGGDLSKPLVKNTTPKQEPEPEPKPKQRKPRQKKTGK